MKKTFLLAIFLTILCAVPKYSFCEYSDEYSAAISAISNGDRQQGRILLEKYIASNLPDEQRQKAVYDLVSMYEEEGRNADALGILESQKMPENTFFYQFEKGWILLSLNRPAEAAKAFAKSKAMTANQSYLSQADFAISISEARQKNLETALEAMARVFTKYPYLLSASSYILSSYLVLQKEYEKADYFVGTSLQYDGYNFQAEADYATLSEKRKSYTKAWQAWRTLQEMDPKEKRYDERLAKLSKKIKGEKENLMFWQRLDWPSHLELRKVYGGNNVSVNLYANADGKASAILEFSFMPTSDFEIHDDRLGLLMSGKQFTPWKIVYNTEEKMLELHDNLGASTRSTYSNIRIISKAGGAVILIKDPLFTDNTIGVNRGDKEAGGELDVIITPDGMRLKTIIDEESLACPITSGLIDRTLQLQFAKAAAIAVRTRIRHYHSAPRHEDADMCDSAHCLEFAGMQAENTLGTEAVAQTLGQSLVSDDGQYADVSWVKACAGVGRMCHPDHEDNNMENVPNSAKTMSPFSIYASLVASPDEELYCIPESGLNYVDLNWTLTLSPYWIEARANRIRKIGKLKAIYPLRRSKSGNVVAIRAEGTKGNLDVEGEKAISDLLVAGSLRSTLFSIRPIYKGKYPEYFIVRGMGTAAIGTDMENALCLRGAEGMAARKDADYKAILANYFHNAKIVPENPLELPTRTETNAENTTEEQSETIPEGENEQKKPE